MNLLEQYAVLSKINESYCKNHGISSSNALDDAFDELENALDNEVIRIAEESGAEIQFY